MCRERGKNITYKGGGRKILLSDQNIDPPSRLANTGSNGKKVGFLCKSKVNALLNLVNNVCQKSVLR
jgi:hypothetical protein